MGGTGTTVEPIEVASGLWRSSRIQLYMVWGVTQKRRAVSSAEIK